MEENPFLIKGYKSPAYFCDRAVETDMLLSNISNGADTTLISPRKYGKSGLIHHVFYQIEAQHLPFKTLFLDIYATLSLSDFIKALADAILQSFPEKSSIGSKFMQFVRGFRPILTYDSLTGVPQVEFNYNTESEQSYTLHSLLEFLDSQSQVIVVAIDEFQQISEYPEQNIEALLRSYIQQMHNVRFIFCGSKRKLMSEMFLSANRPFFSSTRTMSIGKIDSVVYAAFIKSMFAQGNILITDDALNYVLEWTYGHTFYTQALCNELYAMHKSEINVSIVKAAAHEILQRESAYFLQYRELLTSLQWRMLVAIAKEGSVVQITANQFVQKYKLGGSTNARRTIDALVNKELVLAEVGLEYTEYRVYNVFFSRWLDIQY